MGHVAGLLPDPVRARRTSSSTASAWRSCGPDEFFGEIAALDWGAGFGYPRIAQVVAVDPLEVLVYPGEKLRELFVIVPEVERVIRAAVEHRLAVR